ncbi:GNAT family N-acetyltransferase [Micrococcaceae bacterium Sec5.1]
MSFLIRPAREGDVPGITEVELTAGRTSPAAASKFGAGISAAIMDSYRLVLVAEAPPDMPRDGSPGVVGWAKTHYWDHSDGPAPAGYYLGGITVAPHFRRQGVAAELTEARLLWIWKRADSAWYVVNSRNQPSLALHQRWGFEEVARGPGFHTVTFDGGGGLLLKASRPKA